MAGQNLRYSAMPTTSAGSSTSRTPSTERRASSSGGSRGRLRHRPATVIVGRSAVRGERLAPATGSAAPLGAYRAIHRALGAAADAGDDVTVVALENCDVADLAARRRHWIALRGTLDGAG